MARQHRCSVVQYKRGDKIGRWTILRRVGNPNAPSNALSYARYLCVCECGTRKIQPVMNLASGHSQSCGCYKRDEARSRTGKKHWAWKGGRSVDPKGYVRLTGHDYPGAVFPNSTYEHVVVMARHLGRPLFPDEIVHHKNGVRDDNRISNLELWVRRHPYGQRVQDLVGWATELLRRYAPEKLRG